MVLVVGGEAEEEEKEGDMMAVPRGREMTP